METLQFVEQTTAWARRSGMWEDNRRLETGVSSDDKTDPRDLSHASSISFFSPWGAAWGTASIYSHKPVVIPRNGGQDGARGI